MRKNRTCTTMANESAPSIRKKETSGMAAGTLKKNAHREAELVDGAADLPH